ncbi:MAG: BspA family leucine-rich repeat surface protein, partial [Balneolaceae bacterium]
MKKLILSIPFLILWFVGFSAVSQAQDFFLAANGVTVMCPDANVGETGEVNSITYTKRTKEEIDTDNAETTCTSGITNMAEMFFDATFFNGDISAWDVSGVTDMSSMFYYAGSFNGDISTWDVSGVTNMGGMFTRATFFNGDISAWDVSGVTDMGGMFFNATHFNGDISAWDVSGVTDMLYMFSSAGSFNGNISTWDVSSVMYMGGMFNNASSFNQDISGWDVSGVTDMSGMFYSAGSFNGNISTWDVSGVTDMTNMFTNAGSFNGNISTWDVSGVTNMSEMFFAAGSFNGDISTWNVSGVTNMYRMFYSAGSFNGDISAWEVSGVTSMTQMFYNAGSFNRDLSGWCVEQFATMPNNFDIGAATWVLPRPVWGTCPVGMPELQSLADDATDVELSPTFSWSAARYAETYTIQLSTSDNFDTDVSEVSEITETENTLDSTLVHGQKYYWRVRGAKNFETGDWSASRTFTTLNNFERLASNGRTIVCHDVEVGESGVIDGITYTKRTKAQINTENAETTCTSGITDMYQMFSNAGSFNGNISTWDVSSVWNMSWMFS